MIDVYSIAKGTKMKKQYIIRMLIATLSAYGKAGSGGGFALFGGSAAIVCMLLKAVR